MENRFFIALCILSQKGQKTIQWPECHQSGVVNHG